MASGSDKSCESLGNGCLDLDELSISYGTACTIEVTSKNIMSQKHSYLDI